MTCVFHRMPRDLLEKKAADNFCAGCVAFKLFKNLQRSRKFILTEKFRRIRTRCGFFACGLFSLSVFVDIWQWVPGPHTYIDFVQEF